MTLVLAGRLPARHPAQPKVVRPEPAARVVDAVKVFDHGDSEIRALNGVNVDFERSRFTAIMGPSGSGKSTLLHSVAGLAALTSGHVFIGDVELGDLDDPGFRLGDRITILSQGGRGEYVIRGIQSVRT